MHLIRKLFSSMILIVGALLLVEPGIAAPHQSPKPQIKAAKAHAVSYLADGTAIATGAPRRLSPLAGNDAIAWRYAGGHAARRTRHAPATNVVKR